MRMRSRQSSTDSLARKSPLDSGSAADTVKDRRDRIGEKLRAFANRGGGDRSRPLNYAKNESNASSHGAFIPHHPYCMTKTIAFIEDNDGYRRFLEVIVGASRRFAVVGSYHSVRAALSGLPKRGADLVLVDIRLPDHSGIVAVTRLRERWPHTQCVMLTNSDERSDLFAALEAGAAGYLLKNESRDRILAALDEVAAGGAPLSHSIARRVVGSFASSAKRAAEASTVTRREREIMSELTNGFTYKEIGRRLGISGATVKNHLYSIYEKLGVRSRTEAVVKWLKR